LSITGKGVAEVVGLKMLCYCSFSDWVNTASRTESSGEAFDIHISEATHNLLDRLGIYCCNGRGLTQIKEQLLPGVFLVAIYGIRWTVCSTNSQDFVKSHAFTTGKNALLCDTHRPTQHTHTHTQTHTQKHTYPHTHKHTHKHTHTNTHTYTHIHTHTHTHTHWKLVLHLQICNATFHQVLTQPVCFCLLVWIFSYSLSIIDTLIVQ